MEQFLLFPEPIQRQIKDDDDSINYCCCFKGVICTCESKKKLSYERLSLPNACACVKAIIEFQHEDKRRSMIAKRFFLANYSHLNLVDYKENLYCGYQPSWSMSFPNIDKDKEFNDKRDSTENIHSKKR